MSLLTVLQLELHSLRLPAAISDSPSINTLLLEVMMSSKNEEVFFVIWPTLLYKSHSTLGGLQWMWAQSVLLVGIILDMRLHGTSICTAESRTPASLASYILFVIKFFAFIRKWDQLPGKTVAGKIADCKVTRTNRVRSFWINKYNRWWKSISHVAVRRQSWNYNCKIAKEIHIWQFDLTYINIIDKPNTLTWQQRTS